QQQAVARVPVGGQPRLWIQAQHRQHPPLDSDMAGLLLTGLWQSHHGSWPGAALGGPGTCPLYPEAKLHHIPSSTLGTRASKLHLVSPQPQLPSACREPRC
ncbi:unnamed protein product, partial [Gulo gulo]